MPAKKTEPDESPQPARRTRAAATEATPAPDRTLYWAVAFLAAVVFFGAGYLVGHEVGEDELAFPGPHGGGVIMVGEHMPGHPGMYPPFVDEPETPGVFEGRGWLGISGADGPAAVRVVEVIAGSPAAEAGIEPGDRIVAYDGVEVASMEQLADLVGGTDPGTEVEMVLGGPGGGRIVTVTIGERP